MPPLVEAGMAGGDQAVPRSRHTVTTNDRTMNHVTLLWVTLLWATLLWVTLLWVGYCYLDAIPRASASTTCRGCMFMIRTRSETFGNDVSVNQPYACVYNTYISTFVELSSTKDPTNWIPHPM